MRATFNLIIEIYPLRIRHAEVFHRLGHHERIGRDSNLPIRLLNGVFCLSAHDV